MPSKLSEIKPLLTVATIVAVITILILTFFSFLFLKKDGEQTPLIKYKPSEPPQINPVKLPQSSSFDSELSKIRPLLPIRENGYSIEYLEPGNIINVKITATALEQYATTKQKAEQFIKSRGVEDLCALNIFWVPQVNNDIRKSLGAEHLITTGCKP